MTVSNHNLHCSGIKLIDFLLAGKKKRKKKKDVFLTENKELETVSVNTAPAKSSLQNFLSPALCPGCHSAASLSAAAAGMPSQLSGLTKTQEGREAFSEKGIQIQS